MKRISSTPLGTKILCDRKFFYEHGEHGGHPVESNPAMAVGTCFHAMVEFYQTHPERRFPTMEEFEAMKGNYDDPIEAVRKHGTGVYDQAVEMALHLEAERPDLLEVTDDMQIEFDVETLNIHFWGLGPIAGGYLDVFVPSQRLIRDWKCRGGFHYIPRTPEDFMKNVQLCYYAAIMAYHYEWDSVTVEHVNVLRPDRGGPRVLPIQFELPSWYLKGVWEHLCTEVIPDMVEIYGKEDPLDVGRNTAACFEYGPCKHRAYCEPAHGEQNDTRDALLMLSESF